MSLITQSFVKPFWFMWQWCQWGGEEGDEKLGQGKWGGREWGGGKVCVSLLSVSVHSPIRVHWNKWKDSH